MIYKIFRQSEWDDLNAKGSTLGAPIDLADGFIHISTAAQVAETVAKHFAGATDLWIAALEPESLGAQLKWEPSRGGALFPHLYRTLQRSEVVWSVPLPLGKDGHEFPAGVL